MYHISSINIYLYVFKVKYHLSIGNYSGTAHDGLAYHNGMAFSTIDEDNDHSTGSCAFKAKGGWWYRDCFTTNLNGFNFGAGSLGLRHHTGMTWQGHPLKSVQMSIRPLYVD